MVNALEHVKNLYRVYDTQPIKCGVGMSKPGFLIISHFPFTVARQYIEDFIMVTSWKEGME